MAKKAKNTYRCSKISLHKKFNLNLEQNAKNKLIFKYCLDCKNSHFSKFFLQFLCGLLGVNKWTLFGVHAMVYHGRQYIWPEMKKFGYNHQIFRVNVHHRSGFGLFCKTTSNKAYVMMSRLQTGVLSIHIFGTFP